MKKTRSRKSRDTVPLNFKLSSGKLSYSNNIWRAFGAIMYILEQKGQGTKLRGTPLLFNTLTQEVNLIISATITSHRAFSRQYPDPIVKSS
jgi:hypothetical protein